MGNDIYRKRLQASIDFIEENLREELPLKDVSYRANASLYHFHRLFRAFTGYSLKEYIRTRRLTAAAGDLLGTKKTVLEIAFEYRYSSPEGFQRAFKAAYGITPREFRKRGVYGVVGEKADLLADGRTMPHTEVIMNPRIVEKAGMRLFGSFIRTGHGICHEEIGAFRKRMRGKILTPGRAGELSSAPLFGACFGFCGGCDEAGTGPERFTFVIGWEAMPGETAPDGFAETELPGGTYAVFTVEGGEREIGETMNRMYREWLPSSGYELSDSPILERYEDARIGGDGSSMEIWLPVWRKNDGK